MHGLVGHLATSDSDSVAEASSEAVSDSVSEASNNSVTNSSHQAVSNEATMSPNKGTRSRDKTMSSNETSVSSNEVGHRGCSGSSHESDDRCKGLEKMLENQVGGRGVCVCLPSYCCEGENRLTILYRGLPFMPAAAHRWVVHVRFFCPTQRALS